MTSEENNDQTLAFLEEHNYFGYPQEKVKLFKQGKAKIEPAMIRFGLSAYLTFLYNFSANQ